MPPVVFEPTIPTSAWPQTYALDRAATGLGCQEYCGLKFRHRWNNVVKGAFYLFIYLFNDSVITSENMTWNRRLAVE
jgi:hypothetical protein